MRKYRHFAMGMLVGITVISMLSACAKTSEADTKPEVATQTEGTAQTETEKNEPEDESTDIRNSEMSSTYVPFEGTVLSLENGELSMDYQNGDSREEMIVTISDDTLLLDAVDGYPIEQDSLTAGKEIHAYVGEAVTMSLPPIANGRLILADPGEDGNFPIYTKVKDLEAGNADGEWKLTDADGNSYTIGSDTRILPYLTRNIVTEEDLTQGTEILLWTLTDDNGKVEKIVIFQ